MKNSYLQGKRALLILLACLMGMAKAMAQSFTVGDLNYSVNEDGTTVTVTGHVNGTAATGSLVIPESVTYEGTAYAVTVIGYCAFQGCQGFTGYLSIPNSITLISRCAFAGCNGFIGDLVIPNGVTEISGSAFGGCSGFTSVYYNAINCTNTGGGISAPFEGCGGTLVIGENVEIIPNEMFCNTSFSGDLIIPNSVTEISTYTFRGCSSFSGILAIGSSVNSLGQGAFCDCTGFTEVHYKATNCAYVSTTDPPFRGCGGILTIGENVERIPNNVFCSSSFSGDLIIPNSVTSIGGSAFGGCNSFTGTLTIPNSVTSIEYSAFSGCSDFSEVHYNATNCADAESFNLPFAGCGGSLIIGDNVERIPAHMFETGGFTGTLTIPNSVTDIGTDAFSDCSGFTGNLVIPGSITTIREHTFSGCSGFSGNLVISEGVTTIDFWAFLNCSGFSGDLVIPSTVTAIGDNAFTGCSGFSEVFYNATNCANASHYSTFSNCGGTLTIGENVERIPDFLFMNAAFSGDLIIPDSVTSLGGSAFQDCIGLTSLTIGDSLAEIGTFAFAGCSNFSSITVYAVQPPTQVPYGAFQDVPKDIPVYVPCDLVDEYQSAMFWDEFTNYVEALPYHLIVEAIEPEHCTVSIVQHPSCDESQGIVKAEPAEGYVFVAWEEEGTVVSTNAVYTFTVNRDIHLVARVKSNTSVSEGSDESIAVYPNPTCGKVCIKAKDIKNVGVYNLLGQSLFECEADGDEFIYDFSEHGTGLYLIRVETSSGIAVKKVSVR